MSADGDALDGRLPPPLEADPEEYARLISSLLIKVTEFFRDPKVFTHLRDERPAGAHRRGAPNGSELRALVGRLFDGRGGVLARDDVASRRWATTGLPLDVRIFATDIDSDADRLRPARAVPGGGAQNVPRRLRARYFSKSDGGFEVAKALRSMMVFGEHDLGARAPFPRIDLILCRNVLIYFTVRRCSGRRSRRSATRCAKAATSCSARPRRWRPCPGRIVEEHGPAAHLPAPARRLATAADRARQPASAAPRPPSSARQRHPGDAPGRPDRAPTRPKRPRRCCSTWRSASSWSTRATTSPGSTRRPGGCSGSTAWPSTRTSSTWPNRCRRRQSGRPSTPRSAARPRRRGLRGRGRPTVGRRSPAFIETVVRPYVRRRGAIDGAVIELTDITGAERDRVDQPMSTERRLERAAAVNRRLLRRQRRADRARRPAPARQPGDAPVERGGPGRTRGGRDPQRGVPGDERGARDAERGADRERRGAARRQRGPRGADR